MLELYILLAVMGLPFLTYLVVKMGTAGFLRAKQRHLEKQTMKKDRDNG